MQISKSTLVAHRAAIEDTYDSTATIYSTTTIRDKGTGQTKPYSVTMYTDKPCRISSKTDSQAISAELYKDKKQIVKMFISPDINVPVGSKIDVTKNGNTTKYINAGKPFIYDTHQEIILETE